MKILSKCFANKERSFESGQVRFGIGWQVKKTVCKWYASGLQVVQTLQTWFVSNKAYAKVCLLASN